MDGPHHRVGGVHIATAPADLILAMKLRASGERRNTEDIAVLIRHTRVTTVEAPMSLYESFYPRGPGAEPRRPSSCSRLPPAHHYGSRSHLPSAC